MTFAPVQPRPTYSSLTRDQKAAADVLATLPAQVRLQAQLDGAVRTLRAKINGARNAGIEPPGALLQLVTEAEQRAASTRAALVVVQNQMRDAVREGVYRGWFTYQQAVDSGIFRAPAGSGLEVQGLGEVLTILAICAGVALILGVGVTAVVENMNRHRAAAIAAQNSAVATATQLQAWWTAAGYTGAPPTANPDGSISPANPNAPTPTTIPGTTPASVADINNNPAGSGVNQQGPSDLTQTVAGVVKWGLIAAAAVFIVPRILSGVSRRA